MCTLGLLLGVNERFPLLVAANRDEAYDRPSTRPELWPTRPSIFAGRDLLAGGTWLGVNEHGLLAGLTNLWTTQPPDRSRRSRGELVRLLLDCTSIAQARQACAPLNARDFNPFLALCAHRNGEAFWIQSHDRLEIHPLAPGVHAFGNTPPSESDTKSSEAAAALRRAFEARSSDEPEELLARLRPVLAEHRGQRGPRESICVHTEKGYGTVSASIYLLGARSHCFHSPGAPCETAFEDLSEELGALGAA